MAITTYAELQTTIGDWLNRSDLSTVDVDFITLAEAELKKDSRCKRLENHGSLTVDAETEAVPTDFLSLESLRHDGTTYFGPIEIVGADTLATIKGRYGTPGPPTHAAVLDGVFLFAPVPDGTYTLKLAYWQTITALSAQNTTNWLLTSHPDIYLNACLKQAAIYLKDDERALTFHTAMDVGLEKLHLSTWNYSFSGTLRRQIRPIG